jgi:hypothetical protein
VLSNSPVSVYRITDAYYPVPSESRPGITYAVTVHPKTGAVLRCDCPDFRYRRDGRHQLCKHAEKVRAGQAGKVRLRAVPVTPKPAPFVRPPLSAAARDAVAALYGAD